MDAGKFPKFNKLGGMQPAKPGNKLQGQPKPSEAVQNDPTETFILGNQPVADAKVDSVAGNTGEAKVSEAAASTVKSVQSNIPNQVEGLGLIAGINGPSKTNRTFDGISTHGLKSTSFATIGGKNVASASPLQQVEGTKVPTTSVSFVQSSFEMTSLDDSRVTVASFY